MSANVTSEDAIACALKQDWQNAIRINTTLLKEDKGNIDAHNRLGFAYLKTGQIVLAKKTFQKVLNIDPYNQIALKNLKKLGTVKLKDLQENGGNHISPIMFLEEPGRTKIVTCINVAPTNILSTLSCGQEVYLRAKKYCVEIRTTNNTYLGALPDDLSFKLIKFLAGGNEYQAIVKMAAKNTLIVFLRETNRGKKFSNQPSFISSPVGTFTKSAPVTTDRTEPNDEESSNPDAEAQPEE